MSKAVLLTFLFLIGLVIFGRNIPQHALAGTGISIYLPIVKKPSPLAHKIAFQFSSTTDVAIDKDVYVIDSDGSNLRPLLHSGSPDSLPFWSSDGRYLAYYANQNGRTDLQVMAWATQEPITPTASLSLSNAFFIGQTAAWSPDSTQIVFFTTDNTTNALNDLFVTTVPNGAATNITQSPNQVEAYPDWSPDGEQIVFVNRKFSAGSTVWAIETIRPNTLTRHTLYGPISDHSLSYPTYSPDGSRIAFIDLESPFATLGGQLVTVDQNGNFIHRYPALFPLQSELQWSPDGTQLAFVGETASGGIRVFVLRIADGVVSQSLLPADVRSRVTWSADSQQLIFDAPANNARNLYRFELATATTTPLTDAATGELYAQPASSPVKLP